MGLRLTSCSPRRANSGLSPSLQKADAFGNLAPATGVRTTRLGRTRQRFRPACIRIPDAAASIASRAQRFVTTAKRPSCGRETAGLVALICPTAKAEFYPSGQLVAPRSLAENATSMFKLSLIARISFNWPRCMSLLIAPFGHGATSDSSPLCASKRTSARPIRIYGFTP
jgi:hypothetical protein